jgi:hypothetical protein
VPPFLMSCTSTRAPSVAMVMPAMRWNDSEMEVYHGTCGLPAASQLSKRP